MGTDSRASDDWSLLLEGLRKNIPQVTRDGPFELENDIRNVDQIYTESLFIQLVIIDSMGLRALEGDPDRESYGAESSLMCLTRPCELGGGIRDV
jgi:hypothetical protein